MLTRQLEGYNALVGAFARMFKEAVPEGLTVRSEIEQHPDYADFTLEKLARDFPEMHAAGEAPAKGESLALGSHSPAEYLTAGLRSRAPCPGYAASVYQRGNSMNDQPIHDQDTRQRERSSPKPLSACRATVLGLNGIGRQVALQLAALGVGRLVLVDPGRVSRRHYAAEGFPAEDVGRPKVHVAGQAAHQLNPLLDIKTVVGQCLRSGGAVDAVFCCTAARWARQAGRQALASGIGFYAGADVHDGRMYLPIVCEKPDAVLVPFQAARFRALGRG